MSSPYTLLLSASLALAQMQQPLYSTYSFNPLQHLAGIAPYFEPSDPPRSPSPSQGCSVTKAAYLVRHAAINANDFDDESYLEPFTQKLANSSVEWSAIPGLSFLSTWQPPKIEEEERVTRTGKLEAAQLGVQISYRYPKLRLPKRVWTSSAERTVVSAEGLIRGLEMDDNEIELVTIPESKEAGADSLTPYSSCPKYSSSAGSDQSSVYVEKFTAPVIARLHAMAPGFNWTADDVVGMFEWCGYDTVSPGHPLLLPIHPNQSPYRSSVARLPSAPSPSSAPTNGSRSNTHKTSCTSTTQATAARYPATSASPGSKPP